MFELPQINRCGSCSACCTILESPSLNKPAHTPCNHLCHNGCSIYPSRPGECSAFECFWLESGLPPEFRPDQIGVMIELSESRIGPVTVVYEVRPNAFEDPRTQEFVATVALGHKGFICLEKEDGSRHILFPPWAAHLEARVEELLGPPQIAEPEPGPTPEQLAEATIIREQIAQERELIEKERKKARDEKKRKRKRELQVRKKMGERRFGR